MAESVSSGMKTRIAGFRKQLEGKMRFETSTCTLRRNSHVEVGQLVPRPAIGWRLFRKVQKIILLGLENIQKEEK